jgi:hypothetical protein
VENSRFQRRRKLGITGNNQDTSSGSRSYTPEFLEIERKKRYGFFNHMDETETNYQIKMYFPTIVPPSAIGDKLGLPGEMPDYTYEVSLEEGMLLVKARLTDEKVLKLTGVINSFPDRFYKEFVFDRQVTHFEASFQEKILSIVVHKAPPAK